MSTDKPQLIRIDNLESRTLDRKLVIGRHPACDYVVTLNDRNIGISGRHASIEADGETAWLEDLGSTNGTWVQGERIGKRTRLVSGDRFQLDRLEFEFRAAAVKPAAPPPAPPPPPEPPRAPTTIAVNLEDLALPSPAQLKQASARTTPPRVEPPPPPPAKVEPPPPAPPKPVAEAAPAAPVAVPVAPAPVPKTVEIKALEETPPPAPQMEPQAAPPPPPPPPPPPRPEPAPVPPPAPKAEPPKADPPKADAPKPPASDAKPQKVAGAWVNADHSGKTKILMPGERERLKEQMGSGMSAAEAVSVPTLLFAAPEERRVTLAQRDTATQEWTIGSNADVDVSIPSDGLSGLHAKILRNGQTWTISDLMSANGTFVNGQKINRSHLESGNQLGFGPVLCTFLLPEGGMAAPPPRPTSATAERRQVALPLPLLLGGGVLALAILGFVIYLLLR